MPWRVFYRRNYWLEKTAFFEQEFDQAEDALRFVRGISDPESISELSITEFERPKPEPVQDTMPIQRMGPGEKPTEPGCYVVKNKGYIGVVRLEPDWKGLAILSFGTGERRHLDDSDISDITFIARIFPEKIT
jgi:hypothetical protein